MGSFKIGKIIETDESKYKIINIIHFPINYLNIANNSAFTKLPIPISFPAGIRKKPLFLKKLTVFSWYDVNGGDVCSFYITGSDDDSDTQLIIPDKFRVDESAMGIAVPRQHENILEYGDFPLEIPMDTPLAFWVKNTSTTMDLKMQFECYRTVEINK